MDILLLDEERTGKESAGSIAETGAEGGAAVW